MAIKVNKDALVKRINRSLAAWSTPPELLKLRNARGMRLIASVGQHDVVETRSGLVVEKHIDVEAYARKRGLMHKHEVMREEEAA